MNRVLILGKDHQNFPGDFWDNSKSEILIVDQWAKDNYQQVEFLQKNLPILKSHVWIASSGTLATPGYSKWVALSKDAILNSAKAVNEHLDIKTNDTWGLTLPLAHVGGLGILARAHLLGQKVKSLTPNKWSPQMVGAEAWEGEWLSLVPTQVHDLITQKIKPPRSLRGVIVGGDRLSDELLEKGRAMGWPLLPSFGMTECASQIATAKNVTDLLPTVLPHIQTKIDNDSRLWIKSHSLFSGIATVLNDQCSYTPRGEDWWATQDCVELNGHYLRVKGRFDRVIKIKGEKVELDAIETQLQNNGLKDFIILATPHSREGAELWLIAETELNLGEINSTLLSHQKIKGCLQYPALPKNELGKIRRGELEIWLEQILKKR